MPASVRRFGPGTFKLGPTGTSKDFSCQVTSMTLTVDKNTGDPITPLCGGEIPGAITYSRLLSGTFLQDHTTDGLNAYCETNAGTVADFEFVPSTAGAAKAVGQVIVDPIDFGGDEFGAPMDSDFEFSVVGKPTFTWAGVAGLQAEQEQEQEPEPELVEA